MQLVLDNLLRHREVTGDLGTIGRAKFSHVRTFFHLEFDQLPCEIETTEKSNILAIGDIHGDFLALLIALRTGGVIDTDGSWMDDGTTVIICGDVLDKGGRFQTNDNVSAYDREEVDIIQYIYYTNKHAVKGSIRFVAGNHEMLNFHKDNSYEHEIHHIGWGGYEEKRKLFSKGGGVAKFFIKQVPLIVRVNDFVFLHGGFEIKELEKLCTDPGCEKPIQQLNDLWVKYLSTDESIDQIIVPLLYSRKFSMPECKGNKCPHGAKERAYGEEECKHIIQRIFGKLGLNIKKGGMVIGHTIQNNGIEPYCGGKVWRIDVGLSEAFGSTMNGSVIRVVLNDPKHHGLPLVDVISYDEEKHNTFVMDIKTYINSNVVGKYKYRSQWVGEVTRNPTKYSVPSPLQEYTTPVQNDTHTYQTRKSCKRGEVMSTIMKKRGKVLRKQSVYQVTDSTLPQAL